MHITFLTRKYPPQKGGMETFSYQLMKNYPDDAVLIHHGSKQWHLLWAAPLLLLRGILRKKTTSVYHLGDGVLIPLAPFLRLFTNKPIVVTLHGLELTYHNLLLRIFIDGSLFAIQHFVCVSHRTAQLLKERGVPEDRITIIGHAVVPPTSINREEARKEFCSSFLLDENRPLLITVGRLVKRKGVAWFVENVIPQLQDLNPWYIVISDGPDRHHIEKIIREKKVERFVRLLGKIDEETLLQGYAAADIFVMPNIHIPHDVEGFGFVGIEAASYGTPVISSNIDGIPDAIHHGKNGILIEAENAQGYEQQIRDWIENPEKGIIFGKKAKEYTLQHFRWEDVTEKYRAVFQDVSPKT